MSANGEELGGCGLYSHRDGKLTVTGAYSTHIPGGKGDLVSTHLKMCNDCGSAGVAILAAYEREREINRARNSMLETRTGATHLTAQAGSRIVANTLSEVEREVADEHIKACGQCRAQLARARGEAPAPTAACGEFTPDEIAQAKRLLQVAAHVANCEHCRAGADFGPLGLVHSVGGAA